MFCSALFFFFNDTATTEIYTLSLHDALPISVLGTVSERAPTFNGDLSSFAGIFEGVGRGRPTTVTIAADAGALTMKGAGPPAAPPQTLTYRGGDMFGVKDTLVIFEREGGRVTRLRLDSVF